jgi:hypothetical protein
MQGAKQNETIEPTTQTDSPTQGEGYADAYDASGVEPVSALPLREVDEMNVRRYDYRRTENRDFQYHEVGKPEVPGDFSDGVPMPSSVPLIAFLAFVLTLSVAFGIAVVWMDSNDLPDPTRTDAPNIEP